MVEPVSECAEVGLGVLAVNQRLEGARHHGLEVPQHGVDPLELGKVQGLECAHHPGHVDASGSVIAAKHPRPSLVTMVSGSKLALAHLAMAYADVFIKYIIRFHIIKQPTKIPESLCLA